MVTEAGREEGRGKGGRAIFSRYRCIANGAPERGGPRTGLAAGDLTYHNVGQGTELLEWTDWGVLKHNGRALSPSGRRRQDDIEVCPLGRVIGCIRPGLSLHASQPHELQPERRLIRSVSICRSYHDVDAHVEER